MTQKLVMVIDDDPFLVRAAKRILSLKFEVDTFLSGEDAFDALFKRRNYDGIVCDVNMNGMSGQDFLRRVQNNFPELASRFMFYTASIEPHSLRIFNVPVLMKPATSEALLEMVDKLVGVDPPSGS